MPTTASLGRRPAAILTAVVALGFGALVYLLLPAEVTTVGDDFGYYRSIIETLQHHRPWTDAWLEPWAASLSTIAAIVFQLTGSFHLATYGLQAVLAALACGILCRLLQQRATRCRWRHRGRSFS